MCLPGCCGPLYHEPHRPHKTDQTGICKLITKPNQIKVSKTLLTSRLGGEIFSARVWLCRCTGVVGFPRQSGGPDLRDNRTRIRRHRQGCSNGAGRRLGHPEGHQNSLRWKSLEYTGYKTPARTRPSSTISELGPTCSEPAIWSESLFRFIWLIPVFSEHRGSPN